MVLFYSEPMDNYGEATPMYQYRFANKPFVDGVRKAVISVNPLSRKFTLESDMLSDINILDIDYINYDALFFSRQQFVVRFRTLKVGRQVE